MEQKYQLIYGFSDFGATVFNPYCEIIRYLDTQETIVYDLAGGG